MDTYAPYQTAHLASVMDHFYVILTISQLKGLKRQKNSRSLNIQKLLGTRTGAMYYSNDCQGSLLIIYVDILIMARENGRGGYTGLRSCTQAQILAAHFYYFSAAFSQVVSINLNSSAGTHTQPAFEVKVAAVIKLEWAWQDFAKLKVMWRITWLASKMIENFPFHSSSVIL